MIIQFLVSLAATLSFAVLFSAEKKQLFFCGLTGAIAAIHKLKRYYDEKHFVKDPDYMVRMDRLLSVIKDHETDEEMDQWKVWLKYFVTMGGGEWNEFWGDVK